MARIVSELIYKLTADDKELTKSLQASQKRAEDLAKSFTSAGKALTIGLTAPIVALGAAALKLTVDAGKLADRLLDLEQITGLSTDTLQEFRNVAVVAGVDFESLVGVLGRFSGRLPQLESESAQSAAAVATLGVSLRDTNGNLRAADELFPEFITALQQVDNITERNALSQQIFGRSLEAIAPVLGLTSDQLQRAREEARELGLVQSREALEAANAYRIEIDKLRLSIQGQAQEIGTRLIPIFENLIPIVRDAVDGVVDAVKAFTDLDPSTQNAIIGVLGFAAAIGPVLLVVGKAITAVNTMKAAIIALKVAGGGPIALAIAGLVAVAAGIGLIIGRARELQEQRLSEQFGALADRLQISAEGASDLVFAFDGLAEQFNQVERFNRETARELFNSFDGIAESLGISNIEVAELFLELKDVTPVLREQVQGWILAADNSERVERSNAETAVWLSQSAQRATELATATAQQAADAAEIERLAREAADRLAQENTDRARAIVLEKTRLDLVNAKRQAEEDSREAVRAAAEESSQLEEARLADAQRITAGLTQLEADYRQGAIDENNLIAAANAASARTREEQELDRIRIAEEVASAKAIIEDEIRGREKTARSQALIDEQIAAQSAEAIARELAEAKARIEDELRGLEKTARSQALIDAQELAAAKTRIEDELRGLEKTARSQALIDEQSYREQQRQLAEEIAQQKLQIQIEQNGREKELRSQALIDEQNARRENEARILEIEQQRLNDSLDLVVANFLDRRDLENQDYRDRLEAESEFRRQMFEFATTAINGIDRLGSQLFQNEIDRINQSSLAEEEKERQIALARRKQAEFDKAVALTSIVINTAIGISKALPNPFLVALTAALGAAQFAAVAAQPLPQIPTFAQGGSFTVPQGFANDSFPLAMAQSGERVTVETPAQAAANGRGGINLHVGTIIANPSGLRELDLMLKRYGSINNVSLGVQNG